MEREGTQTEYKREFVEDFKYAVVAFANTDGGELYFGVNDDGTVCGVADADDVMLRVTNTVRDAIRPDVTLFTKCDALTIDGKSVIRLTVQQASAKPYYLKAKGIRPEGVYVRQGASSVPASEAAILQMIKNASGAVYEAGRSIQQELTFAQSAVYFAAKGIEFGDAQQKTLGIIGMDGTFTNLGLLLSDQCPHIIKVAIFQGSTKTLFKDRREFGGSLLKQLEDAFAFLDLCNRTRAEIVGLERIDSRDYPGDAIRETLLNLIIHRDYAVQSPALISVFDDRMEFVSVGGLMPDISYDDIMLGVSVARNPRLANVFYRLHLIEAYGTGILKINESYNDTAVKPKIEVSSHAFKVTLPNANFEPPQVRPAFAVAEPTPSGMGLYAAQMSEYGARRPMRQYAATALPLAERQPTPAAALQNGSGTGSARADAHVRATSNRAMLIDALLAQQSSITRRDLETALATSQANAVLILRRLLDEGRISKVGSGKNVRYVIRHG